MTYSVLARVTPVKVGLIIIALLERCREKNFKLNPNKLQLVTESKKHPTLVMY